MFDLYIEKVKEEIMRWGVRAARPIDSLYLGGGTPSLLGGDRIAEIVGAARDAFGFESPEITLECNPADDLSETLLKAADSGVNRVSLGVQTANEKILKVLGRRHKNSDVIKTVADARAAGINNISLDLMLGLPESSLDDVKNSLDFLLSFEPSHISVYMLGIEEGTPFYKNTPPLPTEDEVVAQYALAADYLEAKGFSHYEISNFAKQNKESRHNLKYWNCDEYIGIGPSAHSFFGGKRFYYERNLQAFLNGTAVTPDGSGGNREEYLMLRLRLKDGIIFKDFENRYGAFPTDWLQSAKRLANGGYAVLTDKSFALNREGFLVSNKILGEFI